MRSTADNGGKGGCRGFLSGMLTMAGSPSLSGAPVRWSPRSCRIAFRASDVFPHLPFAPIRALFFSFLVLFLSALAPVMAGEEGGEIRRLVFPEAKLAGVRDALVESIEASGLVVTAVIPFNRMLDRTAKDLGRRESPFSEVAIVQFCSARLAWQLVEENADQVVLCPMSIVVYQLSTGGGVVLSYRSPGAGTPGRRAGSALLAGLVERTAELVRLGW